MYKVFAMLLLIMFAFSSCEDKEKAVENKISEVKKNIIESKISREKIENLQNKKSSVMITKVAVQTKSLDAEHKTKKIVKAKKKEIKVEKPVLKANQLYVKCASCHGLKAEKSALNKSLIIQNWSSEKIINALIGYKNDTYGREMKGVMKSQVINLSDEDISKLAEYITTLK